MNITKATSRDKKRQKKRNGMTVSGKSIFLIQEIQIKKAVKIKKKSKLNSQTAR